MRSPAGRRTGAYGAGTLEQALEYALRSVEAVTPDLLARPTPCRDWDLRMLLRHGCDSLAALTEGFSTGRVELMSPAEPSTAASSPVQAFRFRAGQLLAASRRPAGTGGESRATVGNCPIAVGVLAATGAIEMAAHGWDVARAAGSRDPLPDALAIELLAIAPLIISSADRYPLFGEPVCVPRTASASDQLAAFLGRDPGQ